MILNTVLLHQPEPIDPYPFILLNLFLSMLAALQAPVIMMSQNRQDAKDRIRSELDYRVNVRCRGGDRRAAREARPAARRAAPPARRRRHQGAQEAGPALQRRRRVTT